MIPYDDDWHIIIQLYFISYHLIITWNEYFIHVLFCTSVPAHKISKALWWSIYWSTINTWCKGIYIKDNMLQGWNQWKPSNTRTQFSFQDSLKQIETNIGLFYFVFKFITMKFRRQFEYYQYNENNQWIWTDNINISIRYTFLICFIHLPN